MDLVYPRTCALCGAQSEEGYLYLCWNCRCRLPLTQLPVCEICGRTATTETDYICPACRRKQPAFDRARAAAHYRGLMRDMVLNLKYHNALWLSHDLGILLAGAMAAFYQDHPFDAVTFVPLSWMRRRTRSFNQARLLASSLAHRSKPRRPVWNCLERNRFKETQTHLAARARQKNVRGAFRMTRGAEVQGKTLLLVDDVMTTGATVDECARVLKQAGAKGVYVLTLCR
ncbi:MAG: ComF family protein [Kiritimatiellia bacterium]